MFDIETDFPLTPLQYIHDPWLNKYDVRLLVKRLDLLDRNISGNKAYKLLYNLHEAQRKGINTLVSFGGPYSNHLHALAATGHRYGFKTVGIIRGAQPKKLGETLVDLTQWGMALRYMSNNDYRYYRQQLAVDASTPLDCFDHLHEPYYVIPEGGSNVLGAAGCRLIIEEIERQLSGCYDYVAVACGTGATLAGIASGLSGTKVALGIAVLKANYIDQEVLRLMQQIADASGADKPVSNNWRMLHDYHCGGYAKFGSSLVEFMQRFSTVSDIPLEPIYTAKLFYAIYQLVESNYFSAGDTIVVVHTGGLQGLRGMAKKITRLQQLTVTADTVSNNEEIDSGLSL